MKEQIEHLKAALAYAILNAITNGAHWSEDIVDWVEEYRKDNPQPNDMSGGDLVRRAVGLEDGKQ